MTLERKRIVVFGGTSGIGLAVAKMATAEGASLVVASSSQRRIDHALENIGGGVEGHIADAASEESVKSMFSTIGDFDHLVYTAGDPVWQSALTDAAIADARVFFDVRFWGAFLAVKHASKYIREGGSVVLTSSTLPRRPGKGFAIGASISAAVEAFASAAAVELAPIRVNVVAPGIVRTALWDRLPDEQREALFASRGSVLPVGKVGEAADVAELYLALMRSGFTSGQTVVVDGGMTLI
jgi:NAD(P)-dependent dehydrogenase (short-subunit alcohol dehydrogenase family)